MPLNLFFDFMHHILEKGGPMVKELCKKDEAKKKEEDGPLSTDKKEATQSNNRFWSEKPFCMVDYMMNGGRLV
jgi:hypothetical protein